MNNDEAQIYSIPGFAEPVSCFTHLIGAVVFAILSYWLIRRARGHRGHTLVAFIFALTVVFQLSMSGVYHLLSPGGAGREVLRRLDHAAIFCLIAGSFTIVHGILFRHLMRWGMISLVWALVVTAVTLKTIFFDAVPEWISLSLYLGLGWLGVLSTVALMRRFGFCYVQPLMWGGLAYTVGAVLEFVKWPWLIDGVIGPHELFHAAVLAGLGFHWYFAVGIADAHIHPPQIAGRFED